MYEKVGVFILSILLLFSTLLSNKYYRDLEYSRREYRELREQYNTATEQQYTLTTEIRNIREGIGECIELTRDSEEIYSRAFTSIRDLKEGIRILREHYEALEDRLYKLNDNIGDYNPNLDMD